MALIIRPKSAVALPDKGVWTNRFEIRSETSNRIYVIAQHKETGGYGCSCPSYCTRRKCKHLIRGCGLDESQIHGNAKLSYERKERLS